VKEPRGEKAIASKKDPSSNRSRRSETSLQGCTLQEKSCRISLEWMAAGSSRNGRFLIEKTHGYREKKETGEEDDYDFHEKMTGAVLKTSPKGGEMGRYQGGGDKGLKEVRVRGRGSTSR